MKMVVDAPPKRHFSPMIRSLLPVSACFLFDLLNDPEDEDYFSSEIPGSRRST
jgi:hypothetical protein